MCGKGRAEPPISTMQIEELARQAALWKLAIRRAKRAEENAKAFCEAAARGIEKLAIRRAKRAEENAKAFCEAAARGSFKKKKDRKE